MSRRRNPGSLSSSPWAFASLALQPLSGFSVDEEEITDDAILELMSSLSARPRSCPLVCSWRTRCESITPEPLRSALAPSLELMRRGAAALAASINRATVSAPYHARPPETRANSIAMPRARAPGAQSAALGVWSWIFSGCVGGLRDHSRSLRTQLGFVVIVSLEFRVGSAIVCPACPYTT